MALDLAEILAGLGDVAVFSDHRIHHIIYRDKFVRLRGHVPHAQTHDVVARLDALDLAANQVGVLRRVFVFTPAKDEVAAVANAEIVEQSEETEVVEEGCLSIQGVLVPIERPASIVLVGKDEGGNDVRFELEGIYARAAQHELDHLDGVLIIDRTTPEARREALALLRPRIVIS